MEYAAPILSALTLIVSMILLIVVVKKEKGSSDIEVIKDRLNGISTDQKGSQAELRREVNDMSRMLSENLNQRLELMEHRLQGIERSNTEALNSVRETVNKQLLDIREDNVKRLEQMRVTVDDKLQRTLDEKMTLFLKNVGERLDLMERRLQGIERSNAEALNTVRETVNKQLLDIREDNGKRLEQIRVTVDEKLQKTLEEKMTLSFKSVSERLEQVHRGLGEMQSLALGVGDLKKVLSNVKTRGILGEIQLGSILDQILSPEQYDTDVTVIPDSSARVEFAIKLPGDGDGHVYLPIDAKFHGDSYSALQDAYSTGDKTEVERAMKVLITRIKSSAKDIHDKYIKPPYTTNFGIMFLPFEGLYADVVNQGMVEELQRDYQVNIAGPSTMAAMLNALQMGFRTLAIQKRSDEVWQVLSAVKGEFGKFAKALDSTRTRMRQADEELTALIGTRTNMINRSLKKVEALEGGLESLVDIIQNTDDED